jgi:hypothetical protein
VGSARIASRELVFYMSGKVSRVFVDSRSSREPSR